MAKYSDFNLNFYNHPVTGDLSIVTDEKSINQSIKTLIFLDSYEVPFSPEIAGNIRSSLFKPLDGITMIDIKSRITTLLDNYEPRIQLNDVYVSAVADKNKISITINYTIKTSSENITFNFYIDRIV